MNKFILCLFSILIFISCEKKPIDNQIVFKGQLGIETNQIGSNIPILQSYTNRQGFPDNLLVDIPKVTISDNKLFVADSYNKKISVFSLADTDISSLILSIPNQGENYQFARPYDIWINDSNDIFILASIQDMESYEVQNYNNQTADIQNYAKFEERLKKIPSENFLVYQFDKNGNFVKSFGYDNNTPFNYPYYFRGDDLGNFYLGSVEITNNAQQIVIQQIKEPNISKPVLDSFELNLSTNINETNYTGTILSVRNFNTTESLALVVEYQPEITDNTTPITVDDIFSSIMVYDINTKSLSTKEISKSNITESILDIDNQDRIFLQSFEEEMNTLKIRIVDTNNNSSIFYTPINSSYYTLFDYFIDKQGQLYNYLINRNTDVIVLQWYIDKGENK